MPKKSFLVFNLNLVRVIVTHCVLRTAETAVCCVLVL